MKVPPGATAQVCVEGGDGAEELGGRRRRILYSWREHEIGGHCATYARPKETVEEGICRFRKGGLLGPRGRL